MKLPIRLTDNDGGADRLEGRVFDALLEVKDLIPLLEGFDTILLQGCVLVMLLDRSSALLVEREVRAIT